MSELSEVRRYWPKAKRSKSGARFWAVGEHVSLTLVADVWEVDRDGDAPLPSLKHIGATIAEAMRAAGFGVRPLGRFAAERAAVSNFHRTFGFGGMSNESYSRQKFAPQRPRKGARLGRRKRTGWDKEETRHFAQWREWECRK